MKPQTMIFYPAALAIAAGARAAEMTLSAQAAMLQRLADAMPKGTPAAEATERGAVLTRAMAEETRRASEEVAHLPTGEVDAELRRAAEAAAVKAEDAALRNPDRRPDIGDTDKTRPGEGEDRISH